MSSIVTYKKGKGPNRDGTSLASNYEREKAGLMSIIEDAARGDAKAKLQLQKSVGAALRKREIGPTDMSGVPVINTMSVAYASDEFIGLELFPLVTVEQYSGSYVVHERRDRLQKPKTKGRGQRGEANEINRRVSTSGYAVEPDQLEGVLEVQVALNQSQPLSELLQLTEDVNHDLALNREREHASIAGSTSSYSAGNIFTPTGGRKWNTETATILADIKTGTATMWRGKGNTRLVGWTSTEVWNAISLNTGLLGVLGMNDRGAVSPEIFLEITGLDGLLVSDAQVDTANIGQSAVYSRLWGNKFGIMRVSDTPTQRNASFGYTFRWTGVAPTDATAPNFKNGVFQQMWFDPKKGPIGSWIYKRSHFEDIVVVAADTAYLVDAPI